MNGDLIMSVRNIVDIFKERVKFVLGPDFVSLYWFGSTATGKTNPESDIDLLLVIKSPLSPQDRDHVADIAIDLCSDYGFLLDIHYYTKGEMEQSPYSFSPFLKAVTNEGILA